MKVRTDLPQPALNLDEAASSLQMRDGHSRSDIFREYSFDGPALETITLKSSLEIPFHIRRVRDHNRYTEHVFHDARVIVVLDLSFSCDSRPRTILSSVHLSACGDVVCLVTVVNVHLRHLKALEILSVHPVLKCVATKRDYRDAAVAGEIRDEIILCPEDRGDIAQEFDSPWPPGGSTAPGGSGTGQPGPNAAIAILQDDGKSLEQVVGKPPRGP